ncbi:response regulator [Bdellovibrio bacteriovorus]|uniref:response regulator n=1 Tax=Bdellovibrio TaxID=958 RepID=UPI0035A86098
MEKTKLLVVDDHIENVLFLSHLISNNDVEIITARNGEQALAHLMDHEFGLALLDVQMPGMSGFELARLIRASKKTKNLPMILMTSEQRERAVVFEGYETGAVDFLFKPLDPHVVRSKVRTFVLLDQQRRLSLAQVQEVENLKRKAEEANLAKSHFLANISHEIRTPLGAVLGFADILNQDKLSEEERREFLDAIRRNGELLSRLIDDLLDLSKIEAQRLDFERKEISIKDILSDVQSILGFRASEKGIALQVESPATDLLLMADPLRIKQVLLNVIGNAVKFTDKGQVRVQVKTQDCRSPAEAGHLKKVIFTIEDTGLGLTPAEVQRLFQPFSQADVSTARRFGGTGLGLVISRQLARLMGGDLQLVSSQVGVGSVFEVSLLLELSPYVNQAFHHNSLREPLAHESSIAGKVILVVDDVGDNRLLIDRYLRPQKINLLQAGSGQEALDILQTTSPDLILMDIQMPMMDGYEAVRRIRMRGYKAPIIALTAHAMREETRKCLSAGCDAVLTKPTRRNELVGLLQEWLSIGPKFNEGTPSPTV